MSKIYQIGDTVFGNWTLKELLGEGSYGRVYRAERDDFGVTYQAAVKIITIPRDEGEIKNARAEGMDDQSVTAYFRGFVEELVREFSLMSRLKGTANVVSYEDHQVIPHEDGFGWDILIRMELLTPLVDHLTTHQLTQGEIIKMGIDLCRALELCQKFNIVHRDIKPENIFLSPLEDYKLGDFGIARTVEKTTGGLSRKGTYTYMAPEVYREEPYGSSVDIYSLGVVLYRLLNDNRAPFLPAYPAPITHADREAAMAKRLGGAALPPPRNADGRLAEIVLKACAYDPKDRYSSPAAMRQDLEAVLYQRGETAADPHQGNEVLLESGSTPVAATEEKTESAFGAAVRKAVPPKPQIEADEPEKTQSVFSRSASERGDGSASAAGAPPVRPVAAPAPSGSRDGKKKTGLIAGVVALALVAAIGIGIAVFNGGNQTANPDTSGNLSSDMSGEENGEPVENGLAEVGETFDSLIWGQYVWEGGRDDYSDIVDKLNYHTVTYDGEEYEISTLPVGFQAGPNSGLGIFADSEARTYFGKANIIYLDFCDKNGKTYFVGMTYKIDGNKLSVAMVDNLIEKEINEDPSAREKYNEIYNRSLQEYYELYVEAFEIIGDWMEWTFTFDGRNLILKEGRTEITLVPYWFAGIHDFVTMSGTVREDNDTYHGIAHIYYHHNLDEPTENADVSIRFTDGFYAIDPTIELSEDGKTMTIRWEERWSEYNHQTEKIADPTELTVGYIHCADDGLILVADGKYYCYQGDWDSYFDRKMEDSLGDADTSSLSDEQKDALLQTQSSILRDLQDAFAAAGVEADIDETTGRVTMDNSILFAFDDATLSDTGKAYLDGFLDVYTAVILSDAYAGSIAQIQVEGHTDTNGGYAYNQTLSEERAAAVADYCVARQGNLASVITTKGCSYDDPVYDAEGNVDMAASRRVVFKFILDTKS